MKTNAELKTLHKNLREVRERLATAEQAVTDSNELLKADLVSGRDTSASRRILFEALALRSATTNTLAGIEQRIAAIASADAQTRAQSVVDAAARKLEVKLSPFRPTKKEHSNAHA